MLNNKKGVNKMKIIKVENCHECLHRRIKLLENMTEINYCGITGIDIYDTTTIIGQCTLEDYYFNPKYIKEEK